MTTSFNNIKVGSKITLADSTFTMVKSSVYQMVDKRYRNDIHQNTQPGGKAVKWLLGSKVGHALMGIATSEVVGKGYWVQVTGYEHKTDRKEVGRIFFVRKDQVR